jgi:uncharacterized protein YprB with RNaseH-like and TPR domain
VTTPAYGLDIETDTATGGLDPRCCRILAAALATDDGVRVLTGTEASILSGLDSEIATLAPGVLVTWNGSSFDLPFIADRARRVGVRLGLSLVLDPTIVRSHPPLPGHEGSYRARWHGHGHLDAYLAYRSLLADTGESCALKAVARRAGLAVLEPDPSRVHELSAPELRRYVASDARLALALAKARWAEVTRGWQALTA